MEKPEDLAPLVPKPIIYALQTTAAEKHTKTAAGVSK
jgi:hypothetical protein